MRGIVSSISSKDAVDFVMPRHYSGRKPQCSHSFGLYVDKKLVAVCIFGKPASSTLCSGVCGKDNSKHVYELNRLCRVDEYTGQLSGFVSACLRRLRPYNLIIVSYADTGMSHCGYIYQACNFIYTGCTKQRLEFYVPNGGHSRHGDKGSHLRQIRTPKHRYIYFCTKDRRLKKKWVSLLKYEARPYPKTQNKNYVLGSVITPTVVDLTGQHGK